MLLPIIFVVRVGILFFWLSSFRFVEGLISCFSRAWLSSLYCLFFLLLFFEGLDSWKEYMNLVLSWNTLASPSMVMERLAGYSSLLWHLCSLSVCITTVYDLLAFIFPGEMSGIILLGLPLYVT